MPWGTWLKDRILTQGLYHSFDDEGFVATYRLNARCPPPQKVSLQMALHSLVTLLPVLSALNVMGSQ